MSDRGLHEFDVVDIASFCAGLEWPCRQAKQTSRLSRDWMIAYLGEHLVQRGNVSPVVAKLVRLGEHAGRSRS